MRSAISGSWVHWPKVSVKAVTDCQFTDSASGAPDFESSAQLVRFWASNLCVVGHEFAQLDGVALQGFFAQHVAQLFGQLLMFRVQGLGLFIHGLWYIVHGLGLRTIPCLHRMRRCRLQTCRDRSLAPCGDPECKVGSIRGEGSRVMKEEIGSDQFVVKNQEP